MCPCQVPITTTNNNSVLKIYYLVLNKQTAPCGNADGREGYGVLEVTASTPTPVAYFRVACYTTYSKRPVIFAHYTHI